MPPQKWPSREALDLLEEFEEDPTGWGFIDLERLLDAWDVMERLPGQDLVGYRVRYHADIPDFYFGYPLRDELPALAIQWVCDALRELQRRLTS